MFLAILVFLVLPSTPCDPKFVDIVDVAGDFRDKGIMLISAKVCEEGALGGGPARKDPGTDHNVRLKCSTKGDSCVTEDLDGWGNDWERGSIERWDRSDPAKLGNCTTTFRLVEWLKCKFVLEKSWSEKTFPNTFEVNDLHICKLTVVFWSKTKPMDRWEWKGSKWFALNDDESENWLELQKL